MRVPRIHCNSPLGSQQNINISGQALNHLHKVLRLKIGSEVMLFSKNTECHGHITAINKHSSTVRILECATISRESTLDIALYQSLSKGKRLDWVIQKATELGTKKIIPVYSKYTSIKLDQKRTEHRLRHWRQLMINSCQQCLRNQLPELLSPVALEIAIQQVQGKALFLHPRAGQSLQSITINPAQPVNVFTGPEGGFSEDEIHTMRDARFQGITLGPRILRTETAGLAAISALNVLYGDWR